MPVVSAFLLVITLTACQDKGPAPRESSNEALRYVAELSNYPQKGSIQLNTNVDPGTANIIKHNAEADLAAVSALQPLATREGSQRLDHNWLRLPRRAYTLARPGAPDRTR
jgi:hypothetical protein